MTATKGLFISIEGSDGTGKTTQARMLADSLRGEGFDVAATFEPGGSPLGRDIRRLLLASDGPDMCPASEMLLYAADRAQDVAENILPALRQGRVVLAERFVDSSLAYQGYGLGWDIGQVAAINRIATGGLEPDLTILLDPGDEGVRESLIRATNTSERDAFVVRGAGDRIEQRGTDFHRRVRQGYLEIARLNPERVRVVPCHRRTKEGIHETLLEILRKFISEGRK